jgi:hypothetical protein
MLMQMDTFKDFLKFGLNQEFRNDNKLSGVFALDDFITSLQGDFARYIEFFIPDLINISNDPNSDREIKLRILMTFTDALLYCTRPTFNHIDKILGVVNFALEYCCVPSLATVRIS